jgi:hypothetical protein
MMERAGAAYLVISNDTNTADRLLSATAEVATSVELHETKMEGGLMSMSPVTAIEIPANGQVELKPGGYHLMLIGLTRELTVGESVTLVLTFEKAGEITVTANVQEE